MSLLDKPCSGLGKACSTHGKVAVVVGPEGEIFATFSALINDSARLTMLPGPPTRRPSPCRYFSEKPQPSC